MTDSISGAAAVTALVPVPGIGRPAASALASAPSAAPAATDAGLHTAVDAIQSHFDAQQNQVRFRIDHDTHRLVVSVVDVQNGAVLIQIPSADALSIASSIQRTQTALVQKQA